MSAPDYVIKATDRTPRGALSTHNVQLLHGKLMRRGFVLLPSDTCYSLAAIACDDSAHENINTILHRKKAPISLAFPSYLEVQRYAQVDPVTAILLECFTPGPITVVCRAREGIPPRFLTRTIASDRSTIGVRIPDSIVERDVAACTPYPITSVAVRDPKSGAEIRDFSQALTVVAAGIDRFGGAGWGAVEGEIAYGSHSTVVEVGSGSERVKLLRQGHIPFDSILAVSGQMPLLAMEDWG
jgi:L-threonylcarbamoyladenylate synthase